MLRVSLLFGLCMMMSVSARGGVIVNVGDATVEAGGIALVDVTISGTASDPLQSFGFDFTISGGPRRLEFVNPQPDLQLTDGSYVFAGDSFSQINAFAVGAVSADSVPNDTFIGGDSTDSFNDVTLISNRLLARLRVSAATALAPIAGDTFSVTFNDSSFNTFFFDSGFGALTIDSGSSDFTGTVTVVGAAIPEPSSLPIACFLLFALLLVRDSRSTSQVERQFAAE